MGFLATDFVPIGTNGPTTTVPVNKDLVVKAFVVNRTDTSATLKAVLPADASIVDVDLFGAASNAGTTATVSIGTSTTANEIINAQDVKTAGGRIRPTTSWSTNYPNTQPVPLSGDIQIFAKYAETGTASTSGGPYTVLVYYVR
jgi:hypothetical protein